MEKPVLTLPVQVHRIVNSSYPCSMGEHELRGLLGKVGEIWANAGIALEWTVVSTEVSDAALTTAFRNDIAQPPLQPRTPTCGQLQAAQGYVPGRINLFVLDRMVTAGPRPRTQSYTSYRAGQVGMVSLTSRRPDRLVAMTLGRLWDVPGKGAEGSTSLWWMGGEGTELEPGDIQVARARVERLRAPAPLPGIAELNVRVHCVVNEHNPCSLTPHELDQLLHDSAELWKPGLTIEWTVFRTAVPTEALEMSRVSDSLNPPTAPREASSLGLERLADYHPFCPNIFLLDKITTAGPSPRTMRSVVYPPSYVGLARSGTKQSHRWVAHALGRMLGLKMCPDNTRLMGNPPEATGTDLTNEETEMAASAAQELRLLRCSQPAPSSERAPRALAPSAPITLAPPKPAPPPVAPAPPGPAPAPATPTRPEPVASAGQPLLVELEAVIAPAPVKDKVTSLANYVRVEMSRRQRGLPANPLDLHAAFCGPVGTSCKRLARLLAQLYQAAGVPHAEQIRELRGEEFLALPVSGGILILTELVRRDARSTVTQSDRDTGTSRSSMADETQRLASIIRATMKKNTTVLLVGSKSEVNSVLQADGELAALMRNRIETDHYDLPMLSQLFERLSGGRGMQLTPEGRAAVDKVLRKAWEQRDADFSNGRLVARLFDDILERQANRLVRSGSEDLVTITAEDVPSLSLSQPAARARESWLNAAFKLIEPPPDDTLQAALAELDALVGLDKVKQKIQSLVRYISVQQRRVAEGLSTTPISLHLAFVGSPGTGKTTVARLLGRIFKALGLLNRGQTVETDRTGFIAAYRGQTSLKSNATLDQALHGVLFIDEAYTLTASGDEYGEEAVGVILKRMEDDRGKLSVVVAGYTDEMEHFFEANPGLRSRFTQTIHFDDYSVPELLLIFESLCAAGRYRLSEGARSRLQEHLEWLHAQKGEQFGNGRLVRTIFEQTVERQAVRLADDENAELTLIVEEDIHKPQLAVVRSGEALTVSEPPPQDSIEKVLADLDALVGLKEIKEKLRSFINLVRAEKQRELQGLSRTPMTLHMIFSGEPGTGKTTVARLIGRAYRALGLLRRGHLVETDRAGLVATYLGQTAEKVNQVVNRALHGVLFIDEAYALTSRREDPFGEEAVNILVKRLEDDRERLAVVLAGYTRDMKHFLESNPGLRSRFQGSLEFPAYSAEELVEIFSRFCRSQFTLTPAALAKIRLRFEESCLQANPALGNGRMARQMYQEAVERQANRLADSTDPEALRILDEPDIPDNLPGQKKPKMVNEEERTAVAYHEVGHAIVGALLPGGRRVQRISIVAYSEDNLGYVSYVADEARFTIKPEEIRNKLASLMAGLSAGEIKDGYVWSGAHGDLRRATALAEQYVKVHGMSRLGPIAAREVGPALAQRIDEEIQWLLDQAHQRALTVLRHNLSLLDDLAAVLLKAEVLEGEDMETWLSQARLPDEQLLDVPAVPGSEELPSLDSATN